MKAPERSGRFQVRVMGQVTLNNYLTKWTLDGVTRRAVAETIEALAAASIVMSQRVGRGALAGRFGRVTARAGEFDEQKEIDIIANDEIVSALKAVPVAALA